MSIKSNIWENRRVLITGFSGFLGSWLTKVLVTKGVNLWGLDIKPYRKLTVLSEKESAEVKVIKGNVENLPLVLNTIMKNKIEFIFHLAAKALVGECFNDPLRAFSSNIKGTWNILEASRNCHTIKGIIVSSSDKAYGIQSKLPYKETSPLAGSHPYDVSKSCADLLSYTYFYSYGLPVCVTRCGNIFGPGDFNFSRIVPDTIRSILENKTLFIRSNGRFIRDYIYIEDVVTGYIKLAEKMKKSGLSGEAFNFSNENPISVLELVNTIHRLVGSKPNYKILNKAKYEIPKQYLSSKKASGVLGWEPKYTLEEGLKKTINWYKNLLRN